MIRRTRRTSCRSGPAIAAAAAAPSVREASHDGASTDGAVAAPTAARARWRGHQRVAMRVARTLRRPIGRNDGWEPANRSVRRGSGGRRHGRLDLSVNISIVFTIVTQSTYVTYYDDLIR